MTKRKSKLSLATRASSFLSSATLTIAIAGAAGGSAYMNAKTGAELGGKDQLAVVA